MNKRGQALIEFIIILPIILMLIIASIDFGNIIYKKYHLENDLDLVVDLYNQGKKSQINDYIRKNNISISYKTEASLTTISLSLQVKVMTPGLNVALGNPHIIKVTRTIYE